MFEKDGYNVEKWSDVKSLDDLESAKFDLILLDLEGVGRRQSADQGLGLLHHIRERNPGQIVIAFSNQDWSLKHQPFFEKADAVLYKAADYLEFKREVDRLLADRFSLGFYLSRVEKELGAEETTRGLRRRVRAAILAGDAPKLDRYLRRHVQNQATIDRVIQLVQVAIGVAQLWRQ